WYTPLAFIIFLRQLAYPASCCHHPESSAGVTDEANLRSCNHSGACHGHMGAASAAAKCSSGIAGNVLQQNPGDIRKTSSCTAQRRWPGFVAPATAFSHDQSAQLSGTATP